MSDVPSFPYSLLWGERVVRSVADLTRQDAKNFLALAPKIPIRTKTQVFPLTEANEALRRLRSGELAGAAVLSTVWTASPPPGIDATEARSASSMTATSIALSTTSGTHLAMDLSLRIVAPPHHGTCIAQRTRSLASFEKASLSATAAQAPRAS